MLLQFGVNSVISNLVALVGTCSNHKEIKNSDDLRKKFMEFLDVLQPREKPRDGSRVNFISDVADAAVFGDYFSNDYLLDDKNQSKIILKEKCEFSEKKMHLINSGIDRIKFLETGHHDLIDVVVSDVFVLPSEKARAGSTSQALGVIWLNSKLSYGVGDLVEMIVHELTHQLMFVDDLCRPHYNYSLILDLNNWPVSAILNIRRPFDKVLHSAVVAM